VDDSRQQRPRADSLSAEWRALSARHVW
jgi:hypothetical protein